MKIAMIAPRRAQCGVADYSEYLAQELRPLVDLAYFVDSMDFRSGMNEVDLIHVQHQYFLYGGVAPWKNRFARFARQLKAPVVLTVHEFVSPAGGSFRRAAIAATNRHQFRHPSIRRIVVHTESDRERMMAAGIEGSGIVVIRHGIPQAPDLPSVADAKQTLGLDGRFVLTLFGFLARQKGHTAALGAIERLPEDVTLIFAGGPHPDDRSGHAYELAARIRDLDLGDRVRTTGYLPPDEVTRVMAATDVVLAPFDRSSGSGSLAMAFACGRAIVASDIPPHHEILADTPGCLDLFQAGSAESLAARVEALKDDPEQLRELAAKARIYAERHSYAQMARETVHLYRTVLEENAV